LGVLALELAVTALVEAADHRRLEQTGAAVRRGQGPLLAKGVVQADGQASEALGRKAEVGAFRVIAVIT
jgi:hypothetical protein